MYPKKAKVRYISCFEIRVRNQVTCGSHTEACDSASEYSHVMINTLRLDSQSVPRHLNFVETVKEAINLKWHQVIEISNDL